ncbi:MAG TPA: DUF885 family protein [Polyangiaceae bacterium]|nr:DUF885 family protein [Polyangiaceae bacterium]
MTYSAFVDAFHQHRTQNPNARVQLGLSQRLGELPDPTLAAADRRAAGARRLLGTVNEIAREPLAFDDALDLDLARLLLDAELFDLSYEFNGHTTLAQQPRAGDEIGDGIFLLSVSDPRPAEQRLADITGRIEGIPAYLNGLIARLERPVARWVQMDAAKVRELPTLLGSIESWAHAERWGDTERLGRANVAARAALADYERRLLAMPSTPNLHLGAAIAARLVKLRGIEQSLDELHAMARTFLAETDREIESLRARLVDKYGLAADTSRADLQSFLNRRFRVDIAPGAFDQVLSRYRAEHEKVSRFIRERDLFPIPADQSLQILETPGFMRPSIPAGAMTPPAPFREGTATSLIFLTLSEELLDEHTELSIPIMMIHEGIPGHHLQLATASQHPSRIRRHVMANDHAEGWTTMLEDYMLDCGYADELADEVRFCAKRDLCRIGARVAIDLFFMTGERDYLDVGLGTDRGQADPFAAAGELLQAVTGFTAGRVQAELNWYSIERAYPLSYLTGNQLVARLRRELHAAQASNHTSARIDRMFFERYLSSGNMPLAFLRRVFQRDGLIPS